MAKIKYLGKGSMHTQDILFVEGGDFVEVPETAATYLKENFEGIFEISTPTPLKDTVEKVNKGK